ncbi:hypothetical protein TNCV_510171 [Trichonephila clavipes]|nr:hypothetical protein TNCV_510171 [Trichonephila clavipes]
MTILHAEHVSALSFQPGPSNGPRACPFLGSLSRNSGEVDSRKPFSPTISGSNTIHCPCVSNVIIWCHNNNLYMVLRKRKIEFLIF